ncbi:hypothetical protein H5410_027309 [Solanum commersonii]|uniref:Reverse transcriptase n=1 Tax=Solanum commersonii TaxID=4109 RepID=A0A9J5YYV7_SOLCO|nr:hypothetical protein H5410_027309 [Solanum commersonii]
MGRRRRLFLHKICTGNDVWIQGDDQIAQVLVIIFRVYLLSRFVRGMSIIENIMLAQEITHGIKVPQARANVIFYEAYYGYFGEYKHASDELINREKSHFMVSDITPPNINNVIKEVTCFSQKASPITYLGCPLYIGRHRIIYYSHLVEKVSKKICGWQTRILSFGGRITLIKHALQSIPIHTMAGISPPTTTIKYIESIIAQFFWGRDQDKRKYHWASIKTMSLPYAK